MSARTLKGRIEALAKRHQAEFEALADVIRGEVVVPFCDKYGLVFIQGMGMYFFATKDTANPLVWTTYQSADDATGRLKTALKPVFELLDTDYA